MILDAPLQSILEEASDDWIYAGYFYNPFMNLPLTDQHYAALGLAQLMLSRDLLVIGDLVGARFIPRADEIAAALREIALHWPNGDMERPGIGDIAWFDITPAGEELLAAH